MVKVVCFYQDIPVGHKESRFFPENAYCCFLIFDFQLKSLNLALMFFTSGESSRF